MADVLTKTDSLTTLDQVIAEYFERSIHDASQIDASYRQLWETLYTLIRSGGKRLRPQMTLMAYEAFGGTTNNDIVRVAAAQELLHFSLLIHDDVIDRDYTRYGTLNVAGHYRDLYAKFLPDESDRLHFAHSAAILAGDLMLSGAHHLISSSNLSESQKSTAEQLLSLSIFEVAGGELLDTELSFVPYNDGDAIKIARYKTAGYSFMIPLLTGAKLAGADEHQAELLRNFATSLGVAYQLVDDLLGTFGEEETTGKSTTSDIIEGKRTYMVEQALAAMTVLEKDRFESLFGNQNATLDQVEDVKQMLVSTGAKSKTEHTIREYADVAESSLKQLNLDENEYQKFASLIRKVTERAY